MARRRGTNYEALNKSIRMDDDRLPMREVKNWTPDKLALLAYYLKPFAKVCQKAGGWYFLDGFAGNGANNAGDGNMYKGSALIGATTKPNSIKAVLIEKQESSMKTLQSRCEKFDNEVVVLQGDCNEKITEALEIFDNRNLPAFCLLDPEGLELDWEVIEHCYRHRIVGTPYEMLIYFSTPGVMRAAKVMDERMIDGNEEALRRVFGNDSWRPIAEQHRAEKIDGREAWKRYLSLYEQQLRDLGYSYVMSRPSLRDNGRLVYHLVFASSKDAGRNIMEDAFESAYAQPRLM